LLPSWPARGSCPLRREETMLASHDPSSDLASIRMGFLLITAGALAFWRIVIKLLIVAAVVLGVFGLFVVVHALP
jgi:hypothetical protein